MKISNGSIGYTLTLDNSQVKQILEQTRADFARTSNNAVQELNRVQSSMGNIAVLGGSFLSIAAAKSFVTELIHVRGEFQQIENAIETITGSQDKMNSLMTEWKDLTLRSPFRLSEIAQSGKQLLAYGIEVEKVTSDIEMLGNIASGVSAPISDIAYLYGTLKTQGRAYQQDINQFTGRGIPIVKELAKQFGVAESEIRTMTEAGKIGFPEVEKALRSMTSQGGQFFNLIGKQATTLTGSMNRLKHEIELAFNEIGENSEGLLSGGINVVTHLVENYKTLGKTLGVLITTYGAYKAALITVSALDNIQKSSSEIANKAKLEELRTIVSETEANLALAKSEYDVITAKIEGIEVVKANAIAKREELLVSLNNAHAAKAEAEAQVVAAETKYAAYKGSFYVAEEKIALQELENAQTNLNTKIEDVNSASKAYNAQQTEVQTISKKAQLLTTEQSIAAKGVENTQETVNTAVKNANDLVTKRLTLSQHWYAIKTRLAATWQSVLNATMLNNPIVLVVAAVGSLIAAYVILRDTTTSAERAQEAYNKTQEEVKSKLDETKKKADEYINTLRDETATVYQQIQAYNALQALKLKGLENLTKEQIATMDLTELRKLLNASYDDQSVKAQESELNRLENERSNLLKEIEERTKDSSVYNWDNSKALADAKKKLEDINSQYGIQLEKVNSINKEQQLANLPLRDRAQYWENEIKKIEDAISENERLNFGVESTNPLIKENTDAANIFKVALHSANITPLLGQLEEAKKQFSAVSKEMSGGTVSKKISDYNYYDFQDLKKQLENDKNNTPKSQQNTEKYKNLLDLLRKVNKEIDSYNTKSTKSTKTTKANDPIEDFKKQIQSAKDEYDRYLNYMNSNDIVLKATAKINFSPLTKKGSNYEEYLRNIQKQLANTTNKTKAQVQELQYVNDELQKVLNYNAFDKYKEGINEQVDSTENLLRVIELLEDEKQKYANSNDLIEQQKFKFLDEKEIEIIKKTDNAAQSLINTLNEEANPLDAINKKFDYQIELLKSKLEKAKTDIEKESIKINIEQVEAKRTEELKGTPTNNKEYNDILKKFQDLQTKKKSLEDEYDAYIKKVQEERTILLNDEELKADKEKLDKLLAQNTATENEIVKQRKEALQSVDSEILKKSESWIRIFEDYSHKSSKQINDLIKEIESNLSNPEFTKNLKEDEKKVIEDRLTELKKVANEINNPFKLLQEGWDSFLNGKSVEDKLKGIDMIKAGFSQIGSIVNSALEIADGLGMNVSDATKEAVELGSELFNAGADIAEGIASKNPVQIVQGIAKAVTSIFKFNDKKKQRQIQRYQDAVDSLATSFKNLQYATSKALGGDTYKNQKAMLNNLTEQQNEYRNMIRTEQSRKHSDSGKIKEWQQAIVEINQSKQDLLDSLAQDVLQTNAKDLASTLGDALVEAFGKGEDAAKSFEKVANDVLKNAIVNQLKQQFLEKDLQKLLDQLYEDMGGGYTKGGIFRRREKDGTVNFKNLTEEAQEKFKEGFKDLSENFSGALEMYSDLFKDLETDPNSSTVSGAIQSVTEETASIISGQMNAVRILVFEANKQRDLTNKIITQQLERLASIDINTRNTEVLLNKLMSRLDNAGRAYGF